jgi:hypothetical protein
MSSSRGLGDMIAAPHRRSGVLLSALIGAMILVGCRNSGSTKLERMAPELPAGNITSQKYYGGSSSKDAQYVWRLRGTRASFESVVRGGYYVCDEADTKMVVESIREVEPLFRPGTNFVAFRKSFSRHKNYLFANEREEFYLVANSF